MHVQRVEPGTEDLLLNATLQDVHLLVSSFCFYRVSNRYTLGEIFQVDFSDLQVKQRQREMIGDAVLRYLQA